MKILLYVWDCILTLLGGVFRYIACLLVIIFIVLFISGNVTAWEIAILLVTILCIGNAIFEKIDEHKLKKKS